MMSSPHKMVLVVFFFPPFYIFWSNLNRFGVVCSLKCIEFICERLRPYVMTPFGGGQWENLGLYFLESEPETRILAKDFLRRCSRKGKKEAGWDRGRISARMWLQLELNLSLIPAWSSNSITGLVFLSLGG